MNTTTSPSFSDFLSNKKSFAYTGWSLLGSILGIWMSMALCTLCEEGFSLRALFLDSLLRTFSLMWVPILLLGVIKMGALWVEESFFEKKIASHPQKKWLKPLLFFLIYLVPALIVWYAVTRITQLKKHLLWLILFDLGATLKFAFFYALFFEKESEGKSKEKGAKKEDSAKKSSPQKNTTKSPNLGKSNDSKK